MQPAVGGGLASSGLAKPGTARVFFWRGSSTPAARATCSFSSRSVEEDEEEEQGANPEREKKIRSYVPSRDPPRRGIPLC